jgi:hypothetical protein
MAVLLGLSAGNTLVLLVLGCAASFPVSAILLMLDVIHPKLVWNNPQEAMKQNINGVFGMLTSFLVIAVLAAISFGLLKLGAPIWLLYLALGLVSVASGVPALRGLLALAENKYRQIEI